MKIIFPEGLDLSQKIKMSMEVHGARRTLRERLEPWFESETEVDTVEEAVLALSNYECLPQTTLDMIGDMIDRYANNFKFIFARNKRGKLMLSGLTSYYHACYLHPDDPEGIKASQKFLRTAEECVAVPGTGGRLEKLPEITED